MIDSLEDGNATMALEEPDRSERVLAARILDLCRQIHVAEAQLK